MIFIDSEIYGMLNILLKESMEVDVHMDMIIKHLKNAALNTKIASAMLSI